MLRQTLPYNDKPSHDESELQIPSNFFPVSDYFVSGPPGHTSSPLTQVPLCPFLRSTFPRRYPCLQSTVSWKPPWATSVPMEPFLSFCSLCPSLAMHAFPFQVNCKHQDTGWAHPHISCRTQHRATATQKTTKHIPSRKCSKGLTNINSLKPH